MNKINYLFIGLAFLTANLALADSVLKPGVYYSPNRHCKELRIDVFEEHIEVSKPGTDFIFCKGQEPIKLYCNVDSNECKGRYNFSSVQLILLDQETVIYEKYRYYFKSEIR